MNWKWLVLILHLLGSVYRLVLHIVRFRSAGNPTPENVADVYDAETYQRWKAYHAEKSRLHMVSVATKGGETLHSQKKQDQELSVAQIMNSLLPNSD